VEQLEDRLQPSTFIADHIVVLGYFGVVAGADYRVSLIAEDASGNLISDYAGTVTITADDQTSV
jgi:hypothetical protein